MLIHCQGIMDFWDPLSLFSTGMVASTVAVSADDLLQCIQLLRELGVDILDFSIAGFIAPIVALNAPEDITVKEIVIAGTGPSGDPDTGINSPAHQDRANSLAGGRDLTLDDFATFGEERSNWLKYNFTDGGKGLLVNETRGRNWSYDRLPGLKTPVFITNGHNDFMIPTPNNYTLQQRLPNAQLILYPNSGHGHLYQFANLFARHELDFLQSY
ncbi:alpha/beta-hydrolase [Trichoderma barbatum]